MRSSQLIIFFAIFILTLAHNKTPKRVHPLIFNGKDASIKDFPFQAYLCIPNPDRRKGSMIHGTVAKACRPWCGGILISEKYVLTAAHCIVDEATGKLFDKIRVLLGSTSREVRGYKFACLKPKGIEMQDVPSANMIPHRNYRSHDELVKFDIGTLRLNTAVKFSNTIKPAILPKESESFSGDHAIASGWGANGNRPSPRLLKYTTGVILSRDECRKSMEQFDKAPLDPGVICFKATENTGVCGGDSGGPLMLKNSKKVIGLTSYGIEFKCDIKLPTAYTSIVYYLDWIRKHSDLKI